MRKKCKVLLTSAGILIGLELFIFYVIGDEPIPLSKYPFVRVTEPSFYNNGLLAGMRQEVGVMDDKQQRRRDVTTVEDDIETCDDENYEAKAKFFTMKPYQVHSLDFDIKINVESCRRTTFMLIVVHSVHNNTEKRQLIRDTWGSVARDGGGGSDWPGRKGDALPEMRLIFLLGVHRIDAYNSLITYEADTFGDIVQFDFVDDYRNMTYKNLLGITWVNRHCAHARYVLKSDDDVFVNIPSVIEMLNQNDFVRTIIGPYNPRSRSVRDRASKWFLTCSEYPFNYLPPYMSGSAYILTQDLLYDLYISSLFVPWLHIDDLYVTGILAKIVRAEFAYSAGGFIYAGNTPATVYNMARSDVYTRTMPPAADARKLWQDMATFKPPSRLRPATLILMFFALVLVGFCFAFMCVLEMDDNWDEYEHSPSRSKHWRSRHRIRHE